MPKVKKALESIKTLSCLLLVALACCCLATDARADSLVLDPVGDTFGAEAVQLDITSVNATYTGTALTFTINFAGPIFAPSAFDPRSVVGFIDIDSDRNPLTGVESLTGFFAPPPVPNLGVEYGIDLSFDAAFPGYVEIFNAVTQVAVGIAPITFSTNALSVNVPLTLLGGNGFVNYAVIVGTFDEPTDKAPNGVTPAQSAAAVPEPMTMLLLGTGLAGLGAATRRRRKKE